MESKNRDLPEMLIKMDGQFKALVSEWESSGVVEILEREYDGICQGLRCMEEEKRVEVYELIWYTVTRKMEARGYETKEVRRIASIFVRQLKEHVSSGRRISFSRALRAAEIEHELKIREYGSNKGTQQHGVGIARLMTACGYMASDFYCVFDISNQGKSAMPGLLLSIFCGLSHFLDSVKELN